jgi:hypothetical protein
VIVVGCVAVNTMTTNDMVETNAVRHNRVGDGIRLKADRTELRVIRVGIFKNLTIVAHGEYS